MSRDATVLIVGAGGREHALAWKLCQSARVRTILMCPGNAGTAQLSRDFPAVRVIRINDVDLNPKALFTLAKRQKVDLTVIGPPDLLADGIVDVFDAGGLRCFGPTRGAAQIEASKGFAKAFMTHHDIPTPGFSTFAWFDAAAEHVRAVGAPVVVKASGLAEGKGVFVCDTVEGAIAALKRLMQDRLFGQSGAEVVVEDRVHGQELSVMAFCDGEHIALMPPVQDHKALYDGGRGPNTGGMGAFSPVPAATPELLREVLEEVLRPVIDGLRDEERPFRGVIYAGLMVDPLEGVRVLEFNARLGDPEAQVVMPLLETDLYEVLDACSRGTLANVELRWRDAASVNVVAASGGYPGRYTKGIAVSGIEAAALDAHVFHGGTAVEGRQVVTSGGRVLSCTGLGANLTEAVATAYRAMDAITFDGKHVRRDIAQRGNYTPALGSPIPPPSDAITLRAPALTAEQVAEYADTTDPEVDRVASTHEDDVVERPDKSRLVHRVFEPLNGPSDWGHDWGLVSRDLIYELASGLSGQVTERSRCVFSLWGPRATATELATLLTDEWGACGGPAVEVALTNGVGILSVALAIVERDEEANE